MSDLYDLLLAPDEASAAEQAAALRAALRRQGDLGLIGAMSGDSVMERAGRQAQEQARGGTQEIAAFMGQRRAAEAQSRREAAAEAKGERDYTLRESMAKESARANRAREGMGSFGRFEADDGTIYSQNHKTGRAEPLVDGSGRVLKAAGKKAAGGEAGGEPSMKLNDSQSKAMSAAARLAQTMPLIEGFDPGGAVGMKDAWATGAAPGAMSKIMPQWAASDDGQRYFSAARNAIAALLRKESGAAINEDEWRELGPLYVPMPQDAPKVKADKITRLKETYKTLVAEAGPDGGAYITKRFGANLGSQKDPGGDIDLSKPAAQAAAPQIRVMKDGRKVARMPDGSMKVLP